MIEHDKEHSAVAVMCWDHGGKRLVGFMVVRRLDGHACFVDMPPELMNRLEVIDVKFVELHAQQLLEIAYRGLPGCDFEEDRVISREFLQQGFIPSVAGTMRHIPAERIASNPKGVATWEAAGFLVDVGEIDLALLHQRRTLH